jgi:hypothetical protein
LKIKEEIGKIKGKFILNGQDECRRETNKGTKLRAICAFFFTRGGKYAAAKQ